MRKRNHQLVFEHTEPKDQERKSLVTSWNSVSEWYEKLVGDSGHYYHQHVIFPKLEQIWHPSSDAKVLDLGCGQGVLAAWLGDTVSYVGIDASPALISQARRRSTSSSAQFIVADATKPFPKQISQDRFTDIFYVLSLQNMRAQRNSLSYATESLESRGSIHLILNHPHYRIPRQSGWGEHEKTRQVYRWINRYLTSQEIPITAHPGRKNSPVTWSFHHSLSEYSHWFGELGLMIERIDEWSSDKESKGKVAKQENLVRAEIPLFMYIRLIKNIAES